MQDYESFDLDSIKKEELDEIIRIVPWKINKINGKYSEDDKKIIYIILKSRDSMNEITSSYFNKVFFDNMNRSKK